MYNTMKPKFTCVNDIADINSTMEVESGTELARLEKNGLITALMVYGLVRVLYKDEIYNSPAQFPGELKKAFHDGTAWDNPDIDVRHNNWAEIVFYKKDDEKNYESSLDTVITDGFPFTKDSIRKMLEENLDEYIKNAE